MALETSKIPYEFLARWGQDSLLKGAHVQFCYVTKDGGTVVAESTTNAEPVAVAGNSGFPLSDILDQLQAAAVATTNAALADKETALVERGAAIAERDAAVAAAAQASDERDAAIAERGAALETAAAATAAKETAAAQRDAALAEIAAQKAPAD